MVDDVNYKSQSNDVEFISSIRDFHNPQISRVFVIFTLFRLNKMNRFYILSFLVVFSVFVDFSAACVSLYLSEYPVAV